MSLDLHVRPCLGVRTSKRGAIHPFTGQPKTIADPIPLQRARVQAVRAVVERSDARGPDPEGVYSLVPPAGGVEIWAGDVAKGVPVHGASRPDDGGAGAACVRRDGRRRLADPRPRLVAVAPNVACARRVLAEAGEVVIVESAKELAVVLSPMLS